MSIKILSATYLDLKGIIIQVEVDINRGMPCFTIVGLPDASVKESRERVHSAIINSGFEFPIGRITINLAPADVKKIGSLLDLPIAIGILMASGQIEENSSEGYVVFGELSLSGEIKGVKGTLPIILGGMEVGLNSFIFPCDNINESKFNKEAKYYPFNSLKEVTSFLNHKDLLPYNDEKILLNEEENYLDFSEIIGQESAKRALEISAAGSHNIILYGSTGVGKSMLAKALPSILPPLEEAEKLEIAKIYSISGLLEGGFLERPFRAPHHTATKIAIVGGGRGAKPGEITLAHKGVLFLDELLEFNKETLEVLREPLEEGYIKIDRANTSSRFPSDILFVGAFNLCPCGNASVDPRENIKCTCSPKEKRRYLNKLSKAIKDRIDMYVFVPGIRYSDLKSKRKINESKAIKERVIDAREMQKERLKDTKYSYNSDIKGKDIYELCRLNKEGERLLERYFNMEKPSMRAYGSIIKLARTIADVEGIRDIKEGHILEAISYRKDYEGEIM